ncbi:MAG: aspartyl protease family protein [Kiritimatiellae bacterium]|nr:aspartyl protease family protein [Kiritimatiellia bacterium]
MQIVVSAPRSSVEDGDHVRSIMVNALLDTGATNTSIDETIAKKLMLSPIGFSEIGTAGGKRTSATYVADISFPGLGLLPQRMLRIGSCNLSFNEKIGTSRPQNLGALIGRDILSKWLVVWNGPGATVSICD